MTYGMFLKLRGIGFSGSGIDETVCWVVYCSILVQALERGHCCKLHRQLDTEKDAGARESPSLQRVQLPSARSCARPLSLR